MRKKPAAPSRSCGRCAYCTPVPEIETDGVCRRYPPVAMLKIDGVSTVSAFPQVRLADIWCGEFKARGT